jgi:hypothetical protein
MKERDQFRVKASTTVTDNYTAESITFVAIRGGQFLKLTIWCLYLIILYRAQVKYTVVQPKYYCYDGFDIWPILATAEMDWEYMYLLRFITLLIVYTSCFAFG